MINTNEACHYVEQELPEVAEQLSDDSTIYNTLHVIREYACDQARAHNYAPLKKCFEIANALYEKGSESVKAAVENVFVYSFSRLLNLAPEDKRSIKELMPQTLRHLYANQVVHHGY